VFGEFREHRAGFAMGERALADDRALAGIAVLDDDAVGANFDHLISSVLLLIDKFVNNKFICC
jgi:hypothetical protein